MPSKLIRKLLIFSVFIPLHAVSADSNLPSILVFGDSLSAAYGIEEEEGWVNLLEERVKGEDLSFRIINGSVSGETSTGGVERLPGMLSAYSPKVVIIELLITKQEEILKKLKILKCFFQIKRIREMMLFFNYFITLFY